MKVVTMKIVAAKMRTRRKKSNVRRKTVIFGNQIYTSSQVYIRSRNFLIEKRHSTFIDTKYAIVLHLSF